MSFRIVLQLLLVVGPLFLFGQEVQWASEVINYSSQLEFDGYSANQALGAPNSMPSKGYSATAWEAKTDERREFIHLKFEQPMQIRQVIVAENVNPGAVYKIYLYDESENEYVVYDTDANAVDQLSRFLSVTMELTPYKVASVKIRVDCRAVDGANQIDAVGISDSDQPFQATGPEVASIEFFSDPEKLPATVNSAYIEVNPIISPDGKTLFINRKDYPPHTYDDEIWFSRMDEQGNWMQIEHMAEPLNNGYHNAVNSITPDGNMMLLMNEYYKEGGSGGSGIAFTYRTRNGWTFPENGKIKNLINFDRYVHYFLSVNGKIMISQIRKTDSKGESDLHVSFLEDDGTWTEPMNLGWDVNTDGAEITPFLAADNRTLFFASDGHNGFGSSDIFVTRRLDDSWTKWSKPLNLGPKINSDAWDAYFTIPASGEWAYLVKGNDIYRIRMVEEAKPDPVVLIYGKVINAKTDEPVEAKIVYETLSDGEEAGIARSTPGTGEYKIILPYGQNYGYLAVAEGYLAIHENLDVTGLKDYTEIRKDLRLVPVEVGEVVRLNNIFFDYDKFELLPESYPELNRVADFLKENPSVKIEIGGHTDDQGSDEYNLQLSDKRAKAVEAYLLSQDVKAESLKAKGFGETKPLTSEQTEAGRALNRRVEFVILSK